MRYLLYAHIFLSKKRSESCLLKVMIGGKSVGDTTLFHH
jgi:hypothetical protein